MSGSRAQRKRPLTIPTAIETRDGVEWLTFTYTAKGQSTQFRIRIDIDSVADSDLTPSFRVINSVYPRANVPFDAYQGNRWQYESTVNEIGWRLSFLNPELVGKRGLLQRAVDSFRNRFPDSKSRRVARVEKQGGPADHSHSASAHASGTANSAQLAPAVPALVEALVAKPSQNNHHSHHHHGHGHPSTASSSAVSSSSSSVAAAAGQGGRFHGIGALAAAAMDALESGGNEWTYNEITGEPVRKRARRSVTGAITSPTAASAAGSLSHVYSSPHAASASATTTTQTGSGTPRTGMPPPGQRTLMMDTIRNEARIKLEISVDLASIAAIPGSDFRKHYRLFTGIPTKPPTSAPLKAKRERELRCNDLAWKLALLNPATLGASRPLLQRAVDLYLLSFGEAHHWPRPAKRAVEAAATLQMHSHAAHVSPGRSLQQSQQPQESQQSSGLDPPGTLPRMHSNGEGAPAASMVTAS
ncbi:hypothetical protein BC831DRAFT_474083 [Entophlyctis helioformis]|nr:hypothetical protein BC831DRAFT_474083 [Entophlyctis helioformis]